MANNITKSFDDFTSEAAKLIKEYLLACPEDALKIYKIQVPKNLAKMQKPEFLEFVLKIQNLVYDGVRELGMTTPLYYNVNQFLFASKKTITICDVPDAPDIEV